MQTISEAKDKVAKLWGKPKAKDTEYRLMKYHLRCDTEDGVLLHNVMTGELVLLDRDEAALLNELPCKPDEVALPLIEKHFLVPVDYDEHKAMNQLRAVLQSMAATQTITNYTILPTTHCNARCFYCYESDYVHTHMTSQMVHKVVDFIDNHHGEAPVVLNWFGGEPLVGLKQIREICGDLKRRGIPFSSTMISNGYLFDENVIREAHDDWKLNSIQITLDGTEEKYNAVKAYVGVTGSPFKRVIGNISTLLQNDIHVAIRLNLDRYNGEDLQLLIHQLAEILDTQKKLNVYVAPLFDECGFEKVHHQEQDILWLEEKKQALEQLIQRLGLSGKQYELSRLWYICCMADRDDSILIMPDGTIGRCEHFLDASGYGCIDDSKDEYCIPEQWKKPVQYSECDGCPLLPRCYRLEKCFTPKRCLQITRNAKIQSALEAMKYYYKCECAQSHKEELQ